MKRTKVVLFVLGGSGDDDTKVYVYDISSCYYMGVHTKTRVESRKRRPGARAGA
jgi:hypothetical protein